MRNRGLGTGDWGLGTGDWGLEVIISCQSLMFNPDPQSLIPDP
jgi:hypothetical protein